MQADISRRRFLAASAAVGVCGLPTVSSPAGAAQAGEPRIGAPYQIGCYTRPWAAHEYTVALDAIAEAGFKYVGLMTTKGGLVLSAATSPGQAQRIDEEIRKRGLQVSSVYGGDIPVNSLEAGIEGMRKLIDNCVTVRASSLLMGGIGDPQHYDVYYKAIAACCDYALEKKLSVTVKPHGGLNSTGPQCRKSIEQVNRRNFTLWYDPGNIFYYSDGKLDPVDDAASVDGLVSGMSVKDYEHPRKVDLTPGTGRVNFKTVMTRLKKGGFVGGPLVVECLTPRESADGLLAEARQAKAFLEKLTAEI